jgi:hypothetical protein
MWRSRVAYAVTLPRGVDLVDVHATRATLWWAFSTAAPYGGNLGEFGSADIGPNCTVGARRTLRAQSFPPLEWDSGSFAVDAATLYTAGNSGVEATPLS